MFYNLFYSFVFFIVNFAARLALNDLGAGSAQRVAPRYLLPKNQGRSLKVSE